MRRHLAWAALAAVACGSGSSGATNPTNGNGTGGNPNPSPVTAAISVMDFAFAPATTSIKAGQAVKWTNDGASAHTATADGGAWNSGQMAGSSSGGAYGGMTSGGSYSFTFTSAGTYPYHCANHAQMTGTITVTP